MPRVRYNALLPVGHFGRVLGLGGHDRGNLAAKLPSVLACAVRDGERRLTSRVAIPPMIDDGIGAPMHRVVRSEGGERRCDGAGLWGLGSRAIAEAFLYRAFRRTGLASGLVQFQSRQSTAQ